jgi:SAM-dependent methyltransferase
MEGLFDALQVLNKLSKYHVWLVEQYVHELKGDVLDIGSGIGDLVQFYNVPGVRKVVATDISVQMLDALKARFDGNAHYAVEKLDILSAEDVARVGERRFDVITCVNVLEHLKEDEKALQHICRLLKPDGKVCIIVPAFDWLYGTLDKVVGHERRYSRRTVGPKFLKAGFSDVKLQYMNRLGVLTWFMAGRIMCRTTFPPRTCLALDKAVPFLKQLDRFLKVPFGQSLVLFATPGRR